MEALETLDVVARSSAAVLMPFVIFGLLRIDRGVRNLEAQVRELQVANAVLADRLRRSGIAPIDGPM